VEAVWPFRKNVRLDAVMMRLSTGVPGALALTSKGIPAVWFSAAANAARKDSSISLITGIGGCLPVERIETEEARGYKM
jgi:hypothetical protein